MYVIYLMTNGISGYFNGNKNDFTLYGNANEGKKFPTIDTALDYLSSIDRDGHYMYETSGTLEVIWHHNDGDAFEEADYTIFDLNEVTQEEINSSYQDLFLDVMNSINNIAKGYGFVNGSDWARSAYNICELSLNVKQQYDLLHILRNCCAHGHSNEVNINEKTYQDAVCFLNKIRKSNARKYSRY